MSDQAVIEKIIKASESQNKPNPSNTNQEELKGVGVYKEILRDYYKKEIGKIPLDRNLQDYAEKIKSILDKYRKDINREDKSRELKKEELKKSLGLQLKQLREADEIRAIERQLKEAVKVNPRDIDRKPHDNTKGNPIDLSIPQVAAFGYGLICFLGSASNLLAGNVDKAAALAATGYLGTKAARNQMFGETIQLPKEGTVERWVIEEGGDVHNKDSVLGKWFHMFVSPDETGIEWKVNKRVDFFMEGFNWDLFQGKEYREMLYRGDYKALIKTDYKKNDRNKLSDEEIKKVIELVFIDTKGPGVQTIGDFAKVFTQVKLRHDRNFMWQWTDFLAGYSPGTGREDSRYKKEAKNNSGESGNVPPEVPPTNERKQDKSQGTGGKPGPDGSSSTNIPGAGGQDPERDEEEINNSGENTRKKPKEKLNFYVDNKGIITLALKQNITEGDIGRIAGGSIITDLKEAKIQLRNEAVKRLKNISDSITDQSSPPIVINENIEDGKGSVKNEIVSHWLSKMGLLSGRSKFNVKEIKFSGTSDVYITYSNGTVLKFDYKGAINKERSLAAYKNIQDSENSVGGVVDKKEIIKMLGISENKVTGLTSDQLSRLLDIIGTRESGNRYNIENPWGYIGKYQFGAEALIDLGYIKEETRDEVQRFSRNKRSKDYPKIHKAFLKNSNNWANGLSKETYLSTPSLQEEIMVKNLDKHAKEINSNFSEYIGKKHGGVDITLAGLLMGAHLGGMAGLGRFLEGNGDRADAYGTKISAYIRLGNRAMGNDAG